MKEITLELTNKCLNKCIHCSSIADSNCNEFLSFDTIQEMIDKYNPEWINLSGGEPLFHPDIIKIVKYINNKNIKIKLYTSGYHKNFRRKLKSIYKYIHIIVFPYYSNSSNIYDKIVGNSYGFMYTNKAISLATHYKMNIEVHIVPMSLNIDTIDETIGSLLNYNINKINILKLVNQGRAKENEYIIPDNQKQLRVLTEIKEKYSDKIKLGLPLNEGVCVAGKEKMVIMCNGKEIPCESYKDGICKCERIKII